MFIQEPNESNHFVCGLSYTVCMLVAVIIMSCDLPRPLYRNQQVHQEVT